MTSHTLSSLRWECVPDHRWLYVLTFVGFTCLVTARWMDGWMDEWMDGRMDGQTYGQTDRQTNEQIKRE